MALGVPREPATIGVFSQRLHGANLIPHREIRSGLVRPESLQYPATVGPDRIHLDS